MICPIRARGDACREKSGEADLSFDDCEELAKGAGRNWKV